MVCIQSLVDVYVISFLNGSGHTGVKYIASNDMLCVAMYRIRNQDAVQVLILWRQITNHLRFIHQCCTCIVAWFIARLQWECVMQLLTHVILA